MRDIATIKKAHMIGIGGIGLSALARLFVHQGIVVTGSDRERSPVTEALEEIGIAVTYGHRSDNIPDGVDVIVMTLAIPEDNPERIAAEAHSAPVMSYPQMLGVVSRGKYTIAVSGTHGKTTTTAMIAHILKEAGRSPTVIVGSILNNEHSNFIAGESDIFVVEACEYRRSFLHLSPDILVITNIDNDHLDYYKDIEDIQSAFSEMIGKVEKGGHIVAPLRDEVVVPLVGGDDYTYHDYTTDKREILLPLPGAHNQENAQAAIRVGEILGIERHEAIRALANFGGTWRRFEYKGRIKNISDEGVFVYDDYAHHPTEIRSTLKGARELFGDKTITVVFQPHLYSRTQALMHELAESFDDADQIILAPIYAAREELIEGVTSATLAREIASRGGDVLSYESFDEIVAYLQDEIDTQEVIITMGAGDIYTVGERLISIENVKSRASITL